MRNTTETLPHSVELAMRSHATKRVCNGRRDGAWDCMSSNEFLDEVQHFAAGLLGLGVRRGDTFGIVAASSPKWLIVDLGALTAGGSSVPMFVNISEDNLQFEIEDSEMRFLYVEGDEALSRIAPYAKRFTCIVTSDTTTVKLPNQIEYREVLSIGEKAVDLDPQLLATLLEDLDPDAIATIIYTSGSTGSPKGVELSHANLLSQIWASGERFPLDREKDLALSCLPLAHVFERMVVYYYLCAGIPIFFVDDVQNVGACLREVHPTTMTMVPRLLEKLYGKLRQGVEAKPFPLKQIARWAVERAFVLPTDRKLNWLDRVADKLVYSKFREGLGGNFQRVIAGGAALEPSLHRFFLNIGLPVYQGYGLTEAAPVLATNFAGNNKIGTVGPAFPGVELRVAESGEILARGDNIMLGYHHARQETEEVIDRDGWLHTGDLGHLDRDGFLVIDGRAKELLKTSTGKYVSPVPIELGLCESRFIDMAMVVAEGKPFVSALLFIDREALSLARNWSGSQNLCDLELLETERFKGLMEARLEKVNARLNEWEKVRAYRCSLVTPTVEREELTPTMKIRRHVILERYQAEINAIYSGHENIMSPG